MLQFVHRGPIEWVIYNFDNGLVPIRLLAISWISNTPFHVYITGTSVMSHMVYLMASKSKLFVYDTVKHCNICWIKTIITAATSIAAKHYLDRGAHFFWPTLL